MKINKKVLGLVLAGMLSLGTVGCGDNEVVEEPQVQQEERIQDEDLNQEYLEKAEKNQLQEAKEYTEYRCKTAWADSDVRYEIRVDEESNTVIIVMDIDEKTVAYAIATGQWDELIYKWVQQTYEDKLMFEEYGWDNVNICFTFADLDKDTVYFGALNGEIIYNVEDELNN